MSPQTSTPISSIQDINRPKILSHWAIHHKQYSEYGPSQDAQERFQDMEHLYLQHNSHQRVVRDLSLEVVIALLEYGTV
jgi:hypothetical protein